MALPHLLTRSLVTVGALTGMGAAFLVGTSYGGAPSSGPAAPAAPPGDASPAAYTGSGLSLSDGCDELLDHYVDRGLDLVGAYGWGQGGPVYYATSSDAAGATAGTPMDSAETSGLAARGPAPVRATNEESGTNVQETGVDEPDVVKTDGTTLVRIQDGELVTYDLSGPEVQRLASVDVPGTAGPGTELLLSGETVVVLAQQTDRLGETTTDLTTFDVSTPAAPEQTHTATYTGSLLGARLHDGVVRLVVERGLPALDFEQPGRRTSDREATEANRDLVRGTSIGDWLPTVSYDGGPEQPLLECDRVAVPDGDDAGLGAVAVVGFDANAPQAPSTTGLAVETGVVYASADQLYLATYPSFGGPAIDCWGCLDPVRLQGGGVVDRLVPDWIAGGPEDAATHLYAFDLDGIDTTFAASGEVAGTLRDRWSMDAADGVLRVAVGPGSTGDDANSVVTFRQQGNDLVESGRLDDLGRGEQIQSVRWFDTLAIVVTFRQVDPLYAVDLTDPARPTLMGALKVPGFSAYLHPLGERRLLGVGEGPQGGGWGAQAGLFDVTDLTRPEQLDTVQYGAGSTALAGQDPRQLTWLPDDRTVLSVVTDRRYRAEVSVLTVGDGQLAGRTVPLPDDGDPTQVRLVPLSDGRVVLVTGSGASFFDVA
ncbi:hypothetical protein G5V58_00510 [Nocardioides anomalus]|uniref:Benzoate transporter n=1 Tax=Nocardioides anomalus TaxID=2712223 RepID=A0A6G6W8A3_9ACTN|nr:beta-propeller domain-containing protein [Nocardioides anomalus]QIG41454.1 hypothetical protein G5V58_00510 [Nocardioides anomalus]